MRIARLLVLLAGIGSLGCHSPAADGGTVEIVGAGVISTDSVEFAFTTTPDGGTAFFNRAPADRSRLVIMLAQRTASGWNAAQPAPFSGQHRDVDPFVTPDGRRLYFTSDRPRGGDSRRLFRTWYVERTESGWGPPVDAAISADPVDEEVFVSAARGGTVIFGSRRGGRVAVWATRNERGTWTTPEPLPIAHDAPSNPAIAPSGRFIVFAGQVTEPRPNPDLFVTCRRGRGWSDPVPLARGTVNSAWADFAPWIDAGERWLYFTSERPGIVGPQPDSVRPPGDIYRIPLEQSGTSC